MQPSDVLVIGAGPAGSATALRTAQAGLRVTLLDRACFPREKICAEYMSPETLRHLDLLGVLSQVDQLDGTRVTGTTVIGPDGSRLTGLFERAGHAPFRPTGLSLPRRILDQCLVDAAGKAGVRIHEGMTVTDLLYRQGSVAGVAARDAAGRVRLFHARLTVGADGLRSTVSRRLGLRRHGFPARVAFVAHLSGLGGLADQAEMHVSRHGYVGLNPLGPDLANVALVVPRTLAAGAKGNPTRFFLDSLNRFSSVRDRLGRLRIEREVLVTGPFAAASRRVIADGVILVGDAAEFFDPFTGEGICSALRGAQLAATTAIEALGQTGLVTRDRLRSYERGRRVAFAGRWAVERLIGWGMLAPKLFDRAVGRLELRGWAHTLIGVTGDFVPASEILNPRFLAGMIW